MTRIPVPYADISVLIGQLCARFGDRDSCTGILYFKNGNYLLESKNEGDVAIRARVAGTDPRSPSLAYFRSTGGVPVTFLRDYRWLSMLYHTAQRNDLKPSQELYDCGMELAVEDAQRRQGVHSS